MTNKKTRNKFIESYLSELGEGTPALIRGIMESLTYKQLYYLWDKLPVDHWLFDNDGDWYAYRLLEKYYTKETLMDCHYNKFNEDKFNELEKE